MLAHLGLGLDRPANITGLATGGQRTDDRTAAASSGSQRPGGRLGRGIHRPWAAGADRRPADGYARYRGVAA